MQAHRHIPLPSPALALLREKYRDEKLKRDLEELNIESPAPTQDIPGYAPMTLERISKS